MSMDILIEKIKKKSNPSVVGLDPRIEYVPAFIREQSFANYGKNFEGVADAIWTFNKGLIDALYDIVPAVKPQSAYYEMYGIPGLQAMEKTMKYAKSKGLYVILDVKRNDIGATAEAYATAYLGSSEIEVGISQSAFKADSVTVNPYLGSDGMKPFIKQCTQNSKTIFTLVKTSNPSSGELQDLLLGDETLYEKVALLVNAWGKDSIGKYGYSSVGAVVGATYPEQAKKLRKLMPNTYFLVPGYGAQGGTASDVVHAFQADGLGAIVNSSRGIMCAYQKGDWQEQAFAEAARAEAIRMKNEITGFIK